MSYLKRNLRPEALITLRKHEVSVVENVTKFLVYCIEIYKTANKLNGKQVIRLFNQYGILDFIVSCYGALHTTGPEYIIEDITDFIEEQRKKAR
jgi:hypothetical protein